MVMTEDVSTHLDNGHGRAEVDEDAGQEAAQFERRFERQPCRVGVRVEYLVGGKTLPEHVEGSCRVLQLAVVGCDPAWEKQDSTFKHTSLR